MVSFVCNYCQSTLKKPKLDDHTYRCTYASFSCIDCNTDFEGTSYRNHTSCISEAEKYQKALFKGKKPNQKQATKPTPAASSSIPEPTSKNNKRESEVEDTNPQPTKKPETTVTKPTIDIPELIKNAVKETLNKKSKLTLSKMRSKAYKSVKKSAKESKVSKEDVHKLVDEQIFEAIRTDKLSITA